MVFGLFGKKKQKHTNVGKWATVDPALGEAYRIMSESGELRKSSLDTFRQHLAAAQHDEARRHLQAYMLPQLSRETYNKVMAAEGDGNNWCGIEELIRDRYYINEDASRRYGVLFLGQALDNTGEEWPVMFYGEGHLLTVAPTGAGKGQGYVLKNAFIYPGPAVIFDPKGEIYDNTAWVRDMYGTVFKFAPFDDNGDSDCFNPLDFIEDWDDAGVLADLMILPSSQTDGFWDSAARDLVQSLIMFVKKTRPPELHNMREVLRLLSPSAEELDAYLDEMKASDDELLLERANSIAQSSEKMRVAIFQSARTQLEPWASPAIERVTSSTTPDFSPGSIYLSSIMEDTQWTTSDGKGNLGWGVDNEKNTFWPGMAGTIFIVMPPDRIGRYRSVLRVILGMCLNEVIKSARATVGLPCIRPFLFMIDELPQLGYMRIIEEAAAIGRGSNIRLWLFTQDLNQLRAAYPAWESILANCRVQVFFSPGDIGTAEHISRRLGRRRNILGKETLVAEPAELMGSKFKDNAIVFMQGRKPIRALLPVPFYREPFIEHFTKMWRNGLREIPRREQKPEQA